MAVYIDAAMIPYRGMHMSHMMADTLEELHAMAERIGLRRDWFQDHPRHPHYDVSASKRTLAIHYDAQPVTSRCLVRLMSPKRSPVP